MFQIEMPTIVTIELIMDDKGLYESGTYENLGAHLTDFKTWQKTFHLLKNVILYVL
jgi:hypothetical protein